MNISLKKLLRESISLIQKLPFALRGSLNRRKPGPKEDPLRGSLKRKTKAFYIYGIMLETRRYGSRSLPAKARRAGRRPHSR